jgi:hypothetical protein
MRKTWLQKIEGKKTFPKVLKLEKRFPCYNAVHKMGADEGEVRREIPSGSIPVRSSVSPSMP